MPFPSCLSDTRKGVCESIGLEILEFGLKIGGEMKLSASELATQKLSVDTLAFAIQQLKMNGYVVFESVLDVALIDPEISKRRQS